MYETKNNVVICQHCERDSKWQDVFVKHFCPRQQQSKPVFCGTNVAPAKAKRDRLTHGRTDRHDHYEVHCFAGTNKMTLTH